MVKNSTHETQNPSPETPQVRLSRLIDSLVLYPTDVVLDFTGATVIGSKRVLIATEQRRLSVGRYGEEHRQQLSDERLSRQGISAGLLYGFVEVYSGGAADSAFGATYHIGNEGVQVELDMRHNPENVYLGMAEQCRQFATELGFGRQWADSAQAAEADFASFNSSEIESPSNRSLQQMERMLQAYVQQ